MVLGVVGGQQYSMQMIHNILSQKVCHSVNIYSKAIIINIIGSQAIVHANFHPHDNLLIIFTCPFLLKSSMRISTTDP